jgi:ubiquinone/menaquinone biosynthesis C-methylase UbiE
MGCGQSKARSAPVVLSGALRWFFWHFYHGLAWTYDPVAHLVSLGRWTAWIHSAKPFILGPRVLELGIGTGWLQLSLQQASDLTVVGLDESPQMIALTRRRLSRRAVGHAQLLRGRAEGLPFSARSFESVVATFPTEFVGRPATLQEIRRVLSPAGRLIVLPAAWITGIGIGDRLAASLFRVTHQVPSDQPAIGGTRFSSVLSRNGFRVQVHEVPVLNSVALILVGTVDTSGSEE